MAAGLQSRLELRRSLIVVLGFSVGCSAPDVMLGADAGPSPDSGALDASPPADGTAADALVATVNLRCLVDDWDARLPLLAEEIASLAPDAIALQEVCRDRDGRDGLSDLADAIVAAGGPRYASARTDTHLAWDRYDEGIAVLARDLVSSRTLDLPPGAFPRKALITRVRTPRGALTVAATHLSFGDQGATRVAQLAAIREATGTGDIVIAGDFNETPAGEAVQAAVGNGYRDAWVFAHPTDPGPTVPSTAPTARIDYILLAPGPMGIVDASRFLESERDGVRPSDHLAVWARVR